MAFIVGIEKHISGKLIRNEDMAQFPARFRNVIAEKAGIFSRYHVEEGCTSDLGIQAVQKLLSTTGINPSSVDALICATSSPDRLFPATATRIQQQCGLDQAFAFDVNSACAGAVYALRLASGLIRDGLRNVIVVAAEMYSKILNPKDIATFAYFGDGAGALLVSEQAQPGSYEILGFHMGSDGEKADCAQIPAGGTMLPASKVVEKNDYYVYMKGTDIYDFACKRAPETIAQLVGKYGQPERIVPHQANHVLIREIARRSAIPLDNFFINVDKYANTAGASCVIALKENLEQNASDKSIILVAFGAGLSWGGCFLQKV